jgi:hypothetical protein
MNQYNVYDYSNEQPFYANLQDGAEENLWAGTWSSQFGGDGLNTPFYPIEGRELQRMHPISPVPYFEPMCIGQGPIKQPSAMSFEAVADNTGGTGRIGDYLCTSIPPAINSVVDYWSPKAPQRKDPYNQSYQLSSGQFFAGQAPQRGIYTGVEDMS